MCGNLGIYFCVYALGFVIAIGMWLFASISLFERAMECGLRGEKDPVLSFVTSPLGIIVTSVVVAFGSWVSVVLMLFAFIAAFMGNVKNFTKGLC